MRMRTAGCLAFGVALACGGISLWLLPGSSMGPNRSPLSSQPATHADERPNLRGYNALVLINEERVKDELALTEAQHMTADRDVEEFLERLKPGMERARTLKDLPPDRQSALSMELNQDRRKLMTEYSDRAMGMLLPTQQRRLAQIALQLRQEEAFYEPDVIALLQFTEPQLRAIGEARLSLRRTAASLLEQHSLKEITRDEWKNSTERLRVETLGKYESLLTAIQRDTYETLRGPVIAFTKDDLRWELRAEEIRQARSR